MGTLLVALMTTEAAFAAPYPIEITAPRANLPSTHRMVRAYPGLPFNIRAAVVGGMYPFTYSLNNAPVRDDYQFADGRDELAQPDQQRQPDPGCPRRRKVHQVSQTWSISVSTTGFRFVDAVNGSSSGAGPVSSPWRTLLDVQSRGASNEIVYFRSGVYDTAGIPTVNSASSCESSSTTDRDPIIWLAYPGESPIIDHRYSGSATPTNSHVGQLDLRQMASRSGTST